MNTTTYEIGDTVYIPAKDPGCNTIYTIDAINGDQIYLYHPTGKTLWVGIEEIQPSIY